MGYEFRMESSSPDIQRFLDQDMRKSLLDLTNNILEQSAFMTKYTQIGYLKMPIPSDLYQQILEQRQIRNLKSEHCRPSPFTNCLAIQSNVSLVFSAQLPIYLAHFRGPFLYYVKVKPKKKV